MIVVDCLMSEHNFASPDNIIEFCSSLKISALYNMIIKKNHGTTK